MRYLKKKEKRKGWIPSLPEALAKIYKVPYCKKQDQNMRSQVATGLREENEDIYTHFPKGKSQSTTLY